MELRLFFVFLGFLTPKNGKLILSKYVPDVSSLGSPRPVSFSLLRHGKYTLEEENEIFVYSAIFAAISSRIFFF